MKARAIFAILSVIPLGCATETNEPPLNGSAAAGSASAGTDSGGSAGMGFGGSSSTAGNGTSGASVLPEGGMPGAAGTFGTAGTFTTAGTFGSSGTSAGGTSAGTGGAAAGNGSGGKAGSASGGTGNGGTGTAGTASGGAGSGSGGTGVVTNYCDNQTKSPLPYTVNDGFQPSGWQGDIPAISVPTVQPDACAAGARSAGAVGTCSVWRFTPNATTPAWAGVAWSKVWDAQYTHPPVCLAAGATKIAFKARGVAGGEVVTFSGAGGPEVPFTLTNAWKQYEVSLAGIEYNTPADGVDSGFFWKVAPPTPGGGPVTFFVDDIKIIK